MKKLDERTPWEKEWASAFDEASLQPSESVWHSIDGELANKEARKYKRRAFFYQWAAAASFLLACCSIAFILLQNAPVSGEVAQQNTPAEEAVPTVIDSVPFSGIAATEAEGVRAEETPANTVAREQAEQYKVAGTENNGRANNQNALAGGESVRRQEQQKNNAGRTGSGSSIGNGMTHEEASSQSNSLAALAAGDGADAEEENTALAALFPQNIRSLPFIEQKSEMPAPLEANIQKVWMASHMLKKSKKESNPRYLLGASIASNYFNPNFQDNTPAMADFAAEAARPTKGNLTSTANLDNWQEEQQLNQPSINAGIQAAGWIGKKWVLQGGVQYGNYRSTTMAGSYMDAATAQAYPLHYANFSPDKMQRANAGSRLAAPISAINTFEFISVPLKLGYMVLDKKVGLLLSPGISSEIFLRNQLADADKQLSTYTIYGGEEAPFNRVHFRGVMGAQIFYKLSEHYMISLEPNYQHSITDFSKESAVFQSRPSNVGISAGFRYIIR